MYAQVRDPIGYTQWTAKNRLDQGCYRYSLSGDSQCAKQTDKKKLAECMAPEFACACEDVGRMLYAGLYAQTTNGNPPQCGSIRNPHNTTTRFNCRAAQNASKWRTLLKNNWFRDRHAAADKAFCASETQIFGQQYCLGPALTVDHVQPTFIAVNSRTGCEPPRSHFVQAGDAPWPREGVTSSDACVALCKRLGDVDKCALVTYGLTGSTAGQCKMYKVDSDGTGNVGVNEEFQAGPMFLSFFEDVVKADDGFPNAGAGVCVSSAKDCMQASDCPGDEKCKVLQLKSSGTYDHDVLSTKWVSFVALSRASCEAVDPDMLLAATDFSDVGGGDQAVVSACKDTCRREPLCRRVTVTEDAWGRNMCTRYHGW